MELVHLRSHGTPENPVPHNPVNCPVEIRTVQDYVENYSANVIDTRNHGDRHKNGKYHYSVAEEMLVPLSDISRLV